MHRCPHCRTIAGLPARMRKYLRELQAHKPICIKGTSQRRELRRKIPKQGIYVFYEGCVPVYVGRSDKLCTRILQHGRLGSYPQSTPVAAKIARETGASREAAIRRVRGMTVRVVEIRCPNDQATFEIYSHIALGYTRFNDFENR